MPLFQDRYGNWHESKPHYATFKGDGISAHNSLKAKVLILLYNSMLSGDKWLPAIDIYLNLGVNYRSLLTSLNKWVRWDYITRKVGYNATGNAVYYYSILKRGIKFVGIAESEAPVERYLKEVNEFKALTKRVEDNLDNYHSANALVKATKRCRGKYNK